MRHVDPREAAHLADRERIRARIEALIEAWIALLDRLDGDPDHEPGLDAEPEPDDEPSLAARPLLDQRQGWADDAPDPDREFGGAVADPEAEPCLGAPERHPVRGLAYHALCLDLDPARSQAHWADGGDSREREIENEHGGDILDQPHDEEPDEPSLAARATVMDQRIGWRDPTWEPDREDEHDGREWVPPA